MSYLSSSHHTVDSLSIWRRRTRTVARYITRFIAANNCCSRWRRICRFVCVRSLLFLLPIYSASGGAIDNFGSKSADRKKHFADIQLVSFVTYCSLIWEGLSIPPHVYQIVPTFPSFLCQV